MFILPILNYLSNSTILNYSNFKCDVWVIQYVSMMENLSTIMIFHLSKTTFQAKPHAITPKILEPKLQQTQNKLMKTNPLPFLTCLLFVDVNSVFMLYCFYLIVCLESCLSCWEEESFTFTKKASDTHNPPLFAYMH